MTSLFPESWITKFETLHQAIKPVQSNNHFFIKKENGKAKTRFLVAPPKKKDMTGLFPDITYTLPPKPEPQTKPQDEPSSNKRTKNHYINL